MTDALTSGSMSPGLSKVAARARKEPEGRFHSLAHLIDVPALERAYGRIRTNAAVGVDGTTKEQYGQDLERNLRQDFLDCSHGFRPGRSAHDALRALDRAVNRGKVSWILEADVRSFFDSVSRKMLVEMLQARVADGSLLRLIGKCLHVGVLDGAEYSEPDLGTAQGSVLSPLLGNVYLHYALDRWFELEVKPRLRGEASLVRYADDFLIGFERQDDAQRVMDVLGKRLERYGLTLHPDKTRLLPFRRPPRTQLSGKGPATFDFLGFTLYMGRARTGRWMMWCKTRSARLRRSIQAVTAWCRRYRHMSVKAQHAALVRRIRGHFNYFGVSGNFRSLLQFVEEVRHTWLKWLRRRRNKTRLRGERVKRFFDRYALP